MTPFTWIYLGLLLAGLAGSVFWLKGGGLTFCDAFIRSGRVVAVWHLRVLLIVSAGALIGAILFPLAGVLLGMDYTLAEMALNGIKDGGFYGLIWAPGAAFIWGVVEAHHNTSQNGRK